MNNNLKKKKYKFVFSSDIMMIYVFLLLIFIHTINVFYLSDYFVDNIYVKNLKDILISYCKGIENLSISVQSFSRDSIFHVKYHMLSVSLVACIIFLISLYIFARVYICSIYKVACQKNLENIAIKDNGVNCWYFIQYIFVLLVVIVILDYLWLNNFIVIERSSNILGPSLAIRTKIGLIIISSLGSYLVAVLSAFFVIETLAQLRKISVKHRYLLRKKYKK